MRRRSEAASPDIAAVEAELDRLDLLDLAALRVAFRNRTGRIAPGGLSRALLGRVLAYRVQADAWGDLRPDTRQKLKRLAKGRSDPASGQPPVSASPALRPGSVLIREWRGRTERVIVRDGGFEWNGAVHASLSAAALAITGTKWNGHRFFGLGKPARERWR